MLNHIVIIGRIAQKPKLEETETGKKLCNLTLAVPRSYKNANGEYDTDYIPCVLWEGIAENTCEYCKKGDTVGIKGRLNTKIVEDENGKHQKIEIIADKVTFLANAREKDKNIEMEV